MSILFSEEIINAIYQELSKAIESVQIITAYCKINAIQDISARIPSDVSTKRLLVRFRLDDILNGSTDFSIIEYCISSGWEVFIRFDLHAKTYIVDNCRGIIGSANLTTNGLNLKQTGNYELASLVNLTHSDTQKINRLFDSSLKVTQEIFQLLKNEYDSFTSYTSSPKGLSWSNEILSKINPKITTLFSHELPDSKTIPRDSIFIPFLDTTINNNINEIKKHFRWSNAYLWLLSILEKNGGCMYFGFLSSELHTALVEDPKPYRKNVKSMLSNLIAWIQQLDMEDIIIDIPNHSQRIRLRHYGGN